MNQTAMRYISTDRAPAPIGPYSQAVDTGSFVFISGQIPLDTTGTQITGYDINAQAETALGNLREILAAAGMSFANIVKTTIFLRNINDFACFNRIYESAFGSGPFPARSVVEVSALPKNVLVEIEAIACR